MQRKIMPLGALVVLAIIVSGCVGLSRQATPLPPTKTPKPTFTPTPDWTPTPLVVPTATQPPPTATPEATATPERTPEPPSPTPVPVTRLTATQAANIRSGPGTSYPVVGRLSAGDSYDVIAKNANGDWVQFELNGAPVWVTATLVTISGDLGAVEVAQDIAPPPTARPRPTSRPAPTAAPAPTSPPAPRYPFQLVQGSWRCDPNAGSTYFSGFARYRNNSPRNGVCVHVAYYGPRNTKCSGCDGVGDGIWSFSPFGGPAPAGVTVEIYVVPCPSSLPPGGAGVDTPGGFGDLTPQSEKWVRTINASEQCTGITFVGD